MSELKIIRLKLAQEKIKENPAAAIILDDEPGILESEESRDAPVSGTDAAILTILEESDRLSIFEIKSKLRTLGFSSNFLGVLEALERLAQRERVMGIQERTGTTRYVARSSIFD